jgi:endonuclease/exonuclease/phosphatase family metal-dependent hydrolase
MTTRSPARALAAACLTIGALALGAATPAGADVCKDFLDFNACGNVCNHGDQGDGSVVQAIRDSIYGHSPRPDAVTLNEMCYGQFEALQNRINAGDWDMEGHFSKARDHVDDCNGTDKRFGNAVFVRGTVSDVSRKWFSAQAGDELRNIICVKVEWATPTRVCATHLTHLDTTSCDSYPDDGFQTCRSMQAAEVEGHVDDYIGNGVAVVVGGDFNAEPRQGALDHLYDNWVNPEGSGHGDFKEVDQGEPACRCGEDTRGSQKLDYVFVSSGKWYDVGGDATFSNYSDHDPLWGHAWLRTP